MEQLVNFQTQNGVLEIRFNRADKKNALTNAMYQAVQSAMEQAKSDDNIRVILFTST
ncbi:MAG TPA: enoyl-CoA hydratase, partial [Moraxellaceae bacterium]|nr:enoyl-CoA hydratase [Moraxellaceae bacterium]